MRRRMTKPRTRTRTRTKTKTKTKERRCRCSSRCSSPGEGERTPDGEASWSSGEARHRSGWFSCCSRRRGRGVVSSRRRRARRSAPRWPRETSYLGSSRTLLHSARYSRRARALCCVCALDARVCADIYKVAEAFSDAWFFFHFGWLSCAQSNAIDLYGWPGVAVVAPRGDEHQQYPYDTYITTNL